MTPILNVDETRFPNAVASLSRVFNHMYPLFAPLLGDEADPDVRPLQVIGKVAELHSSTRPVL